MSGPAPVPFSIPHAQRLIRDLFVRRPGVYWSDMLLSLTIGYTAAAIYLEAPAWSATQLAAYLVAGFALFRAGSFIHEIVHMKGRQMRSFRLAWDLLAGVPMLMPSFFYGNHLDHHTARHYGTGQDGEYLPLGRGLLADLAYFYLQVLFLPVVIFIRFLIVTPLSFLIPGVRQWALERMSSFVINLQYRRRIPSHAPLRSWALIECLCCLRAWAVLLAVAGGWAPLTRPLQLYALALLTLGLNYVRNLVAHRYESSGVAMSYEGQLADSVNLEGVPLLTELFFPLSLRYHALHHLFPSLPYHNLPAAHRRLVKQLPPSSLYHATIYPGFWSLARELVRSAYRRQQVASQVRGAEEWYHRRSQLHGSVSPPRPGNAPAGIAGS